MCVITHTHQAVGPGPTVAAAAPPASPPDLLDSQDLPPSPPLPLFLGKTEHTLYSPLTTTHNHIRMPPMSIMSPSACPLMFPLSTCIPCPPCLPCPARPQCPSCTHTHAHSTHGQMEYSIHIYMYDSIIVKRNVEICCYIDTLQGVPQCTHRDFKHHFVSK